MEINFSLPELLRAVGIFYLPGLGTTINGLLRATTEAEYNAKMYDAMKEIFYGDTYFPELPKFLPLTMKKTKDIDEDLLIESAIVEISNTRSIITTAIQGRDGTVKEFISNGDYQVSIRGMFALKGLDWPRDNVVLLRQYMEAKQAIEVTHDILNSLGIYEIVITDWSLPQTSFVNIIPFQIQAISDWPIGFTDEYKKLRPTTPQYASAE